MANKKKSTQPRTVKVESEPEPNLTNAVVIGGDEGKTVRSLNKRLDTFVGSRLERKRSGSALGPDVQKDAGTPSGREEGDETTEFLAGVEFLAPMVEPSILTRLKALSGILGQCVNATVNGVFGKGYRLPIRDTIEKKEREKPAMKAAIAEEKEQIKEFLENMDIDDESHLKFRTKTGQNYVTTGNAYWEVVRQPKIENGRLVMPETGVIQDVGDIYAFQLLESINMRIVSVSKKWAPYTKHVYRKGKWKEVASIRRFKSFVQIDDPDSSDINELVYFKEFGDRRRIDEATGKEVSDKEWNEKTQQERNKFKPAKEVIFFKQYFPGSPYGVPVFVGVLSAIVGSILKEENDLKWFYNGSKADLVIMSDAPLSTESVERIKRFVKESASLEEARKALVLSPKQGPKIIGEKEVAVKLQLREINQNKDAQWVEYDRENVQKTKSAFLLSDLHIGLNKDFNRATSETALEIVEENVFKPMRMDYDYIMNHIVFPAMGFVYHEYESKPSIKESLTTLADALYKLHLAGTTLRENRRLIEQVFGTELDDLDEKLGKENAEKLLDVPATVIKDLLSAGMLQVQIGEVLESLTPPQTEDNSQTTQPDGSSDGDSEDGSEDDQGDEGGDNTEDETKAMLDSLPQPKEWFEYSTEELLAMGWELVEEGSIALERTQTMNDIHKAGYVVHSMAQFSPDVDKGPQKIKHHKQAWKDDKGKTQKRISLQRF